MAKTKPAALLIVDVQHDFISGSLAVKDAESILPEVIKLTEAEGWEMIVASQVNSCDMRLLRADLT